VTSPGDILMPNAVSIPALTTFAMAVGLRPISANRAPSPRYTQQIRQAAAAQGARVLAGPLYARITWFQLRRAHGDVDNIAKRILDSLKGVAFQDDDDVVRCLTQKAVADASGSFALNTLEIPSTAVLAELQALLGVEDHVLYIEIGPVTDPTISFGPVS
jgi:endodeoxyribonuclease RusA